MAFAVRGVRHLACSLHRAMSAEHFDSGAVLERASPVLTFSTGLRLPEGAGRAVRKRQDTPTPLPVTRPNVRESRDAALPVIPRIVRRTMLDSDGVLVRAVARAAAAARRSVLGSMLLVGLVALLTLLSVGFYVGEWMRHFNGAGGHW